MNKIEELQIPEQLHPGLHKASLRVPHSSPCYAWLWLRSTGIDLTSRMSGRGMVKFSMDFHCCHGHLKGKFQVKHGKIMENPVKMFRNQSIQSWSMTMAVYPTWARTDFQQNRVELQQVTRSTSATTGREVRWSVSKIQKLVQKDVITT